MNLRDYFDKQKSVSLDSVRKVELYERVNRQIHAPVGIFSRFSFYSKVAIYTSVGLIFLASLYLPYFSSLFQQTDGILTTSWGGASVQADYIAQIIETKGDIAIYNDGEKVESTLFRAGDRLVLPEGGEIVFHITTIAQAKVTWPAEFFVEKNEQGYSIKLIKGTYAEIQSLTGNTAGESIGLQSSRMSIRPKKADKIHFTYTEKGESAIIDNQGDAELLLVQADDENAQEEVVGMHTVASVAEAESGSLIVDTISTGDVLSGHIMTPVQVAKALSEAPLQVDTGKKMIGGAEHENIKAILSAEFLANNVQEITSAYLKGEARAYEVAYINLYAKISQIYTIMEIPVPQYIADARNTLSLKVLITMIEDLIGQMNTNYYVAQSHPVRLKKLLGWLYALREKSFGSEQNTSLSGTALIETLNLKDYKDLTN